MNKGKKNNKKILLISSILIVLGILIGILLFSSNETKNLSCEFSYNNLKINMEVFYKKEDAIDRLEGIIEYDIKDQEMDLTAENFVSMLNSYYDDLIVGDSIDVNVYNEENLIFIKYNIDYKNYDPSDMKKVDFFPTEDSSIPTLESLKNSVEKSGGNCFEK